MIQIVMKPDYDAGIVERESLYKCICNCEDIGLRVRGLRAAHAEEKLMVIFREQLKGKVVDYDLEAYLKSKREAKQEVTQEKPKDDEPMLPGMESVT